MNKGITLIALVITIIVLLILAGVTIATLSGDNGILTQAQKAKNETEKATEKEKIELAVVASQSKSKNNRIISFDDLQQELQKQFDQQFELADNKDDSFLITIDSERMYYVNENGKVFDYSSILKITSAEEFENMRERVNNGDSFDNKVIILMNDITLNGNWTPIGYINDENIIKFNGEFNGLNNRINNLNINSPEKSYQGLFANTGSSSKISNVVITGSITGAKYVGAIVAYNEGSIRNCGNEASVTGNNSSVGGIVGYNANGNINGCYNKGEIGYETTYSHGGIVGKSEGGTIKNCYNNATIKKEKSGGETGGICGTVSETNIYNVYNVGNITAVGSGTGGIVGLARDDSTVGNAYNIGQIQGNDNTGGIVGNIEKSETVQKCYNKGNISGKANVGGIFGGTRMEEDIKIVNCYHYGNVESRNNSYIGTIGGRVEYETFVQNCEWCTDNQEYYNNMVGKTSIKYNENIDMKNVLEIINRDNFFVSNNDNNNPKLYWE